MNDKICRLALKGYHRLISKDVEKGASPTGEKQTTFTMIPLQQQPGETERRRLAKPQDVGHDNGEGETIWLSYANLVVLFNKREMKNCLLSSLSCILYGLQNVSHFQKT